MKSFLARLFCRHRPVLIGLSEALHGRRCRVTRAFRCARCGQVKTFTHDVLRT